MHPNNVFSHARVTYNNVTCLLTSLFPNVHKLYCQLKKLCFRPTSQPTHGEKTVSLTRVPGAPHNYSRPLRPRTAPGPYATKPSTLSSSSQQAPSSKSSITSVVAASESTQQTGTENSTPPLDEKDSAKDAVPPKRGAVSSGKPTSASKPQSRKSASAESEFK